MQSTAVLPARSENARSEEGDTSARWKPLWLATYFVGLGLGTLFAINASERPHRTPLVVVLATVVFAAAWHFALAVRRPHAHRHTKPMIAWAVFAVLVTTTLVWMAPVYLFAASFLYAQIFQLMPTRSATATAMIYTGILYIPINATLGHTFAMIMVGAGIGTCLLSGFISEVVEQNRARRRTITDLRNAESTVADLEKNAGRLEERARIARELHDTVTQDLVGITMQLDAVEKRLPKDPNNANITVDVERLRALSRGALADARQLIEAHRPRQLTSRGSVALALASLGDAVMPVEVTVDEGVTIHPEHEAVLFRVAQEAVSNARKHARASSVAITVTSAGRSVCLDVVDDGVGFDTNASRVSASFGIESMKMRINAARGWFEIESAPGEGTTVHVELPVVQ